MGKIISILMLLMAVNVASNHCQASMVLKTDTIQFVDTIVTKEVITRTEVINRESKVIRYYENGELIEKRINGRDTVIISTALPNDVILEVDSKDGRIGTNRIFVDTLYRPGGRFVWIPDSMNGKVNQVLNHTGINKSEIGYDNQFLPLSKEKVDLNEKVIVKGDTIPMVLKSRNLGRYDRGLFNYLFIPKGIWQIGLTASYGEFSTENLQILDLVSDIDFNGKIFSVRPYFQYFFRSNLSLGLRLGYTRGEAKVGAFNVDIDEDMSFNLHDILYKSSSYSASFTFTQYLGIARKGRFGVFNEVELAMSGGDSDFHRPFNGEMRETHTQTYQAALNFSPGVSVFVIDQMSFNVSLGVFGLNIKHEKQKVNGEDLGWRTTSGANFRFNIFNINFGIAVNI